jgi:hypothetical protein
MTNTLSCKAKGTMTGQQVSDELSWICGPDQHSSCLGFSPDTSIGYYPTYGMCNPFDKLSLAFNTYYEYYNKTNCDFGGFGTLVVPTQSTASCASLLNAAAATGTGGPIPSDTASASASNTAAASGSKKSSAAQVGATTPFSYMSTGLGIYVLGLGFLAGGAFLL